MVTVICWLVIHSAQGKLDNRAYTQFKGQVMKESGDKLQVNFYESFIQKKINMDLNPVVQYINDGECKYE